MTDELRRFNSPPIHVANHKKDSPSGGCLSTALLLIGIAVGLLLLASQMKG